MFYLSTHSLTAVKLNIHMLEFEVPLILSFYLTVTVDAIVNISSICYSAVT